MSGTIHNKPLTHIRDWTRAERLLANGVNGGLNRTHDIVRNLQQGVNQPMQMPSVARGTRAIGGKPVPLFSFQVAEVQRDSLLCHAWDGETAGAEDVIVLRDPLLRRTPFDRKQRDGEWFDYSGFKVDPQFNRILDADGLPIEIYPEDHVTRLAFRFGRGRDRNGNPPIESAVERILPRYFTGYVQGEPEGFVGIDHAGADIILAAAIDEQTVEGIAAVWVEVSDREWYVVSRVEFNATPEAP